VPSILIPTLISQSQSQSNSCNNRQKNTVSHATKIPKGIGVSSPNSSSIPQANDDEHNDSLIAQSKLQSNACNNSQKNTVSSGKIFSHSTGVSSSNCVSIAQYNDEDNDILIGSNQENYHFSSPENYQLLTVEKYSLLSESSWGGTLQQCGLNNLPILSRTNGLGLESLTFVQTSFPSLSLCQGSSYRDLQSFI
jgi:hypothetical protein